MLEIFRFLSLAEQEKDRAFAALVNFLCFGKPQCNENVSKTVEFSCLCMFARSMDKDGKIEINFSEWREFLLLNPDENIRAIVKYWRHSLVSI